MILYSVCIKEREEVELMSDGDERVDGYKLCAAEAARLHELNPNHELLKFMYTQPDEEQSEEHEREVHDELTDRFWDKETNWRDLPGSRVQAYVYGRYAVALREAADAIVKG